MFNVKRLAKYLATGIMPERTALDAAIALAEAMDAIDFAAHDRRYHGGKYDPQTMTCEMRQALEKGDLADVLAAENDEKALHRKRFKEACRRVKDNLSEASDDDVALSCCNFEGHTQKRFGAMIRRLYSDAKEGGDGTLIGTVQGLRVYPHHYMDDEIIGSGNAKFLVATDYDSYMDKARMLRHLGDLMNGLSLMPGGENKHKSKRHRAWMKAKGFWYAPFEYRGKPWYFVFTRTADDRLLLYDYVQKKL